MRNDPPRHDPDPPTGASGAAPPGPLDDGRTAAEPSGRFASDGTAAAAPGPLDPDDVARRALDVGRRTALGVLAGDHATADDVAQEVAIQAVRHAGRIRDARALDAWLHRTAVRAALRTVRRRRRSRDVEAEHVALRVPDDDAGGPTLDDLGRLLVGLPERQRAALTLRYAHDLDDDEIATAIGCRTGTVRALLSRGRSALRARLDEHPMSTSSTTTSGDLHA